MGGGRAAGRGPARSSPPPSLDVASGREAGARLAGLPSARRPTAAFCANDLTALGLLQHAICNGTRVPEELAIVGYDDIEFAAAAAVPLTSVRQPRSELGRAAAELALDEAQNPAHHHRQVQFTPSWSLGSRPADRDTNHHRTPGSGRVQPRLACPAWSGTRG